MTETAAVAVSVAVKEEETQPNKLADSATSISENAPVGEAPSEGSLKPEDAKNGKTCSENGNADAASDDKAVEETSNETEEEEKPEEACPPPNGSTAPVVSSSKRSRPPYKYDINKITLRFLFANRDGLTVTVECKPSDTVGEVKGALLSVWPEGM
jgi:hypothetical protein